jgi:ABC-type molybdate transport system permease subunit
MQAMFAQSLGEYGGIASFASGIQQLAYSVSASLHDVSTRTWIIVAIIVVVLVLARRR